MDAMINTEQLGQRSKGAAGGRKEQTNLKVGETEGKRRREGHRD